MAKASYGPLVNEVRGRVGAEVLTRTRGGLTLKGRPKYRYPAQPAVREGQARMSAAMAAWNGLNRAQVEAWNAAAATISRRDPVSGTVYAPTGQNLFAALACKWLQVHPGGAVPLDPPAATFAGDALTVTVAGGAGQLVFTASAPNAAPAVTELMVQPLPNVRRSPTRFYKSAAFATFAPGALSVSLPYPAGWYACAYRFVDSATGQATEPELLGVVEAT